MPSNNTYFSYDDKKYSINEYNGEYPNNKNNKYVNYYNINQYYIKDEYLCISEYPNSHSFIIENGKICVDNCNDNINIIKIIKIFFKGL